MANDKIYPRRSQMGRITLLAEDKLWNGDKGNVYVLGWRSAVINRVCRSTFQAETQSGGKGVEFGLHIRAGIADAKGMQTKDWEASSALAMQHLWLTDCESVHSYLTNPVAGTCEDKRMETDLEALRQLLWETAEGVPKDTLEEDQTDKIRWIDTSTMVADPLTKSMQPDRMVEMLTTGVLDLEPTEESKLQKVMKRKQRAKTGDDADQAYADEIL